MNHGADTGLVLGHRLLADDPLSVRAIVLGWLSLCTGVLLRRYGK